jgi:hypothetical protein
MMSGALAAAPAETDYAGPQPGPINAGNTYGWRPVKWAFNWFEPCEYTPDPCEPRHYRLRPWERSSNGSRTAYIRWGMMVLDSSVEQFNFPSRGSVTTILDRRGARYGRWEMRLRPVVWYDAGRDYEVLAELVPVDPTKRRCNRRNIALASFTAGGSHVKVFARNAGRQWTYTKPNVTFDRWGWHTYAVEVNPTPHLVVHRRPRRRDAPQPSGDLGRAAHAAVVASWCPRRRHGPGSNRCRLGPPLDTREPEPAVGPSPRTDGHELPRLLICQDLCHRNRRMRRGR